MEQNSIAILGGSFNPIHLGHIELAKQAHKQFSINRILIMPCADPSSYKDVSELLPADIRCSMVAKAIEDFDYMELSKLEIERGGVTYTSDTLKELKAKYDYIYFIIGADSLFAIDRWHEPEYVMQNCHLLASNRDNQDADKLLERINYLETKFKAKIDFIENVNVPYSSSLIRERIFNNESISGMLSPAVEAYIRENNLYKAI